MTADPVVTLGTELQEVNATNIATSIALDEAEGERWSNDPRMPAVQVGQYIAMSEAEIHQRCRPSTRHGPNRAERSRLITLFRDKQARYLAARERAGLTAFDEASDLAM